MTALNLSPDQLLSTTRAVRKRLDLSRPVPLEVIQECVELAVQAPTGTNSQTWHFVVVTDPHLRETLGAIYRKGFATYLERTASSHPLINFDEFSSEQMAGLMKLRSSALYLVEHMHEVPVWSYHVFVRVRIACRVLNKLVSGDRSCQPYGVSC